MNRLDLLVPGLLGMARVAEIHQLAFPAPGSLELLLGRADHSFLGLGGYESVLWYLLYGELESEPPAGLLRNTENSQTFRADPVHFEVGMRDVILQQLGTGSLLDVAETEELSQVVNEHLEELGGSFILDKYGAGYMTVPDIQEFDSAPPSVIGGNGIRPWLMNNAHRPVLNRLFTELQMLMHDISFNRKREMKGHVSVNGLWFWGLATERLELAEPRAQLASTDPLVVSLSSNDVIYDPELTWGDWQSKQDSDSAVVVVSALKDPAGSGLLEEWSEAVARLDAEWIEPAVSALKSKELDQFRLFDENGKVFTLNRSIMRAFWRRPKKLSAFSS